MHILHHLHPGIHVPRTLANRRPYYPHRPPASNKSARWKPIDMHLPIV